MRRWQLKISALLFLGLLLTEIQAQEAILASGGDASGSGGSFSSSLGQLAYTTYSSSNGSVAQGVQHPYEISIATGIYELPINISLSVFPNPTTDKLTLQISDFELGKALYYLIDIQGKILETKRITKSQTQLNLNRFSTGTYFLNINQNDKKVQTFRIIKY